MDPSSPKASPCKTLLVTNKKGGVYKRGATFSLEKKMEIALVLENLRTQAAEQKSSRPVSARQLAKAAKVSVATACKIMAELDSAGGIKDPKQQVRAVERGPGALTLSRQDEEVLLNLRQSHPQRTLENYASCLQQITGTKVSSSTVHKFFKKRFPAQGKQHDTCVL